MSSDHLIMRSLTRMCIRAIVKKKFAYMLEYSLISFEDQSRALTRSSRYSRYAISTLNASPYMLRSLPKISFEVQCRALTRSYRIRGVGITFSYCMFD